MFCTKQNAQGTVGNAQLDSQERSESSLDAARQPGSSSSKKSTIGIVVSVAVVFLVLVFSVLTTVIYHYINDGESGSETITEIAEPADAESAVDYFFEK